MRRVYIFGRGGARRRAEELGVPFLGEVPLNIYLRETGDEGKIEHALTTRLTLPTVPSGRRRATRRPDQHPEHQGAQDAQARNLELGKDEVRTERVREAHARFEFVRSAKPGTDDCLSVPIL